MTKIYKPNIFIKIGATFNIVFACFFSLLGITSIITIPTIVFNSFLYFSKTANKRYWGFTRIIPIILSLILSIVMFSTFFFVTHLTFRLYNGLAEFLDILVFWNPENILTPLDNSEDLTNIMKAMFFIVSILGNIFILMGWYKGIEIYTQSSSDESIGSTKNSRKKKASKSNENKDDSKIENTSEQKQSSIDASDEIEIK